jgi:hypothetical protein
VLIFVGIIILGRNHQLTQWSLNFLLMMVFAISAIISYGLVFSSASFTNLLAQREYDQRLGVWVDKQTIADANLIRNKFAACGYQPGGYVAGLYSLASLINVVSGKPVITSWYAYNKNINQQLAANQFLDSLISPEIHAKMYIVVKQERLNRAINPFITQASWCTSFKLEPGTAFPVGEYLIYRPNSSINHF